MIALFIGLILVLVFVIRLLTKSTHEYFEEDETKKKIGALSGTSQVPHGRKGQPLGSSLELEVARCF